MRKLERLPYVSTFTNASHNRSMAGRAFAAGMTPREIAREWPKVFKVVRENGREVLGQKYDAIMPDGRKETRYMITEESVNEVLAARRMDQ